MRADQQRRSRNLEQLIAVAIPLALLALAYALWAISDRLLWIGPFDRAAFGWIFVIPIWWLAPGVAGLAWSRMPASTPRVAALIVGGIVAAVSGILLAHSITFANCAPVVSWTDNLPASLAIGVAIGAGPAIGALAAASVARRRTGAWRVVAAIGTGGVIGVVGFFGALMTAVFFFPPLLCAPIPQ
jgi:hypothetical protein